MERLEAHVLMNDLIEQIAEHLPGHWSIKPNPTNWTPGATITDADSGAILNIGHNHEYANRNKNLLRVRADLPKDDKGQTPYVSEYGQFGKQLPTINVNMNKTGEQIARAIESRVMTEYLPILAKAQENVASNIAYHVKTEAMAAKIAKIAGVTMDEREPTKVNFYRSPHPVFAEKISEASVGRDDVTLKLDLDYETSLKVLRFLIES